MRFTSAMLHIDGPRLCRFLIDRDIRQADFRDRLLALAPPPGTVSFVMRTLRGVSRPPATDRELEALTAALEADVAQLQRSGVIFEPVRR